MPIDITSKISLPNRIEPTGNRHAFTHPEMIGGSCGEYVGRFTNVEINGETLQYEIDRPKAAKEVASAVN